MTLVALAFSLALAAVAALGVVAPLQFVALARRFQTPAGLSVAAAFRIVLGVALFLAAPASRAPELLLVVGAVGVAAGVATPFVGPTRFRVLLDRLSARGARIVQAFAAIGLGLGLFLAYAVFP